LITASFQNGVYPDASYAGTEDTRVRNGASANSNYGTTATLQLGYDGTDVKRGMFKFDTSSIPPGAVITNAYLTLYCTYIVDAGLTLTAHKAITSSWVETEATWNIYSTGNSWAAAGGDFEASAASDSVAITATSAYYTWKLNASLVQGWLDTPAQNYGIFLTSGNEAMMTGATFSSSENTTFAYRPRLTVYYTAP
jgi:hypothetical protein